MLVVNDLTSPIVSTKSGANVSIFIEISKVIIDKFTFLIVGKTSPSMTKTY